MNKRKAYDHEYVPYGANDNIFVYYELEFGKDVIVPGTQLKIKYDRSIYRFRLMAHNASIDSTWIDVVEVQTGQWRSFHIDRIKHIVKPKKSRKNK